MTTFEEERWRCLQVQETSDPEGLMLDLIQALLPETPSQDTEEALLAIGGLARQPWFEDCWAVRSRSYKALYSFVVNSSRVLEWEETELKLYSLFKQRIIRAHKKGIKLERKKRSQLLRC